MPEMTIEFTEDPFVDSSLVTDVLYNENTKAAFVALGDTYYRYDGVDKDSLTDFVKADSVGAAYTPFKQKFGPAQKLEGHTLSFNRVEVKEAEEFVLPDYRGRGTDAATPKDLTYADDAVVDGVKFNSGGNLEASIMTPAYVNLNESVLTNTGNLTWNPNTTITMAQPKKHVVHFTIEDSSTVRQYKVDTYSVDSAVGALKTAMDALSLPYKVQKVEVYFV